jgi:ABC-type glycerol-3-phosphate transport system substrate-binding protein
MYYSNSTGLINAVVNAGIQPEEFIEVIPPPKRKMAVSAIHTNWLAVGSQSKYPDLAWDFIKLHMSMEYYPAYMIAQQGVPSRLTAFNTDYVKKNPWLMKLLTYASQYGRATWTARDFVDLRDSITPELEKVYKFEVTAIAGLENAANRWKEILARK